MNTNTIDEVNNYYIPLLNLLEKLKQENIITTKNKVSINNICVFLEPGKIENANVQPNLQLMGYNFPIFNLDSKTLISAYNEGYRYFIFPYVTSSLFITFIPFFQAHPECVGISNTSTSSSSLLVNRPVTNMYRLSPDDSYAVPYFIDFIANGPNASMQGTGANFLRYNLFKQPGDNYSENLCSLITSYLSSPTFSYLTGATYNISSTSSIDLALLNSNATGSSTGISVVTMTNPVLRSYFYQQITSNQNGYFIENITSTPPPINSSSLSGYYYFLTFSPPYERNVKNVEQQLGSTGTSYPLYDAVNISISYENNNALTLDTIGSYGYLFFNATGDRIFDYYNIYAYNGPTWKISRQYFKTNEQPPQLLRGYPY